MWTVARSPESAAGESAGAPSSAMIGDRMSEFKGLGAGDQRRRRERGGEGQQERESRDCGI